MDKDVLSSLISGLAGFGSSAFTSMVNAAANKRAYHHQRDLMNLQAKLNYKYQQKMTQWSSLYAPTYARQGLESAGFNPILAVNSGSNFVNAGGSFSSGGSVPQQNPVDFSSGIADILNSSSNAYKIYNLDKKQNEALITNLDAQTRNTNAKTKTEGYNQKLLEAQTFLNLIDTELRKKDLSWYDRMHLMQERTGYLNAAANHLGAEAAQMNAHTGKMNYYLQKEINSYENVRREHEARYIKNHPQVFNYSQGSKYLQGLKLGLPFSPK